jgi:hypothetical protein
MAQYFEIRKGSELPVLSMGLSNDGKYDFIKTEMFNNAIQNADVTFSMQDENGNLKISKAKADVVKSINEGCNETYLIEYKWKQRDTKESGIFDAHFEINFKGDLYQDGVIYPEGKLIMPIHEKLKVHII